MYQRDLVQKTMTQLYEYNNENALGAYTKPTLDLHYVKKNWGWLTTGMSQPELVDFEKAKEQLEHYEKIFSIVEYASDLNEGMTVLERKI